MRRGHRDWNETFTSQGMPKIAGKHQELERGMGWILLQNLQKEQLCQHLD